MYKLFYTFYLIIFSNIIFSQNLVLNSSFEENTACPNSDDQFFLVNNWTNPTIGTPDYFNSCDLSNWVGVPQNASGFELAYKGNAYSGIYCINFYGNNIREYIQSELIEPLESGQKYYVEFYISLADSFAYATKIGAFLSINAICSTNSYLLDFSPQILNINTVQTINKIGWEKIYGTFTATGGEKYITIGNFYPDSLSDTTFVTGGHPLSKSSFYYVDAVTVMLDTSVNQRDVTLTQAEVVVSPNPTNNFVTFNCILPKTERAELYLYNLQGKKLLSKNLPLQAEHFEISLSEFPVGVYFYEITNEFQVIKRDKLVIVR